MNVYEVLRLLRKQGTRRAIAQVGRYGIEAERAFGVPMGTLLKLKKRLGTDKAAPDKRVLAFLPLIEKTARDERNFVMKSVSWALRSIGRRKPALNSAALKVARRLAISGTPSCRWVGKDATRELCRFHRSSFDEKI